ncbi:MAG: hypothetical protein ACI9VS_000023 [Candidatus Binatia bacterium]|jgi:hypothetical protein
MIKKAISILAVLFIGAASVSAAQVLVEAESFESHGGWKLDTQFIDNMGSPYLLAHGLGRPVKDATTTVEFPARGKYRIFVRTKDWVARWKTSGQPGRFQLQVGGTAVKETFGTKGAEWHWHDGGTVMIESTSVKLALHDLTGFDGRCDSILFTTDTGFVPPNDAVELKVWRKQALGLPDNPVTSKEYDLVVVGGGYSGMGAALSAARMGCKVALIQNRPVLGGNGSSEVRVWAMGNIRRGKYPRIGEIIDEIADNAKKSPGTYEEFEDAKKEAIVRAEKNIDLFLNHHANVVEMDGDKIKSVTAFDTRTGAERRFIGRNFVDCTGHGTIGQLAGASYDMSETGRMGMSNMWAWDETDKAESYPATPWALDLEMKDFPYPRDHHGQWFWESGFDKDAIGDAEGIRDWNLRAVYGAFNAMKNRDGAEKHKEAILTWVAYIGGPRESRRLMGDVLLTEEDIVAKRDFPDGCVPSTWSIDLHYPKKQYATKFPDNPFISVAVHGKGVDRSYGYPVPYRCFYSKDIPNLFMAGRNISVTHEALGTVRVMKTCGMMGEVVGKAAAICAKENTTPRGVYEKYLPTLLKMLELPGLARRETLNSETVMPKTLLPMSPLGPMPGLDPAKLKGLVIDDKQAKKKGAWSSGAGLKGYVAHNYLYSGDAAAEVRFEFKVDKTGLYEVRVAYQNHENRAAAEPITVHSAQGEKTTRVNMKLPPPIDGGFVSVGNYRFEAGKLGAVVIGGKPDPKGTLHADAVQILPVK